MELTSILQGKRNLLILAALIQVMLSVPMSNAINTPILAKENKYTFVNQWGSEGVGFGKFARLLDMAKDSNNNVYVTETTSASNQIRKIYNNGTFITNWGYTRSW